VAVYADDDQNPGEPGDLIAEYRYDALNRRIAKLKPDPEHEDKYIRTDFYYTTSWQIAQTREDDNLDDTETLATTRKYEYVWDIRYIDAPVCRDENKNADNDCTDAATGIQGENEGDEHLYYCQDANFNVTALVDVYDGAVVERYMYDPYGKPTVLHGVRDVDGTDTSEDEWDPRDAGDSFQNAILYCGYYFDDESGLYSVRHRYYHPTLGRWLSHSLKSQISNFGFQDLLPHLGPSAQADPK